MKKMVVALLVAAVFMLSGCAGGQAGSGVSSNASASDATSAASQSAQSAVTASSASASSAQSNPVGSDSASVTTITMSANGTSLQVTLADNEAASALAELLQEGPITVGMHAYGGFEKVGPLPRALPASDAQLTTEPGDVMLYQGNQMTVFYGPNTWDYTPLGKIEGATADSLLEALGEGDVEVTLSL